MTNLANAHVGLANYHKPEVVEAKVMACPDACLLHATFAAFEARFKSKNLLPFIVRLHQLLIKDYAFLHIKYICTRPHLKTKIKLYK